MPRSLPPKHRSAPRTEAIQIHGAYGFSDEYDVERYLRNSKGAMIYEGSSEVQLLSRLATPSASGPTSRCAVSSPPTMRNTGRDNQFPLR